MPLNAKQELRPVGQPTNGANYHVETAAFTPDEALFVVHTRRRDGERPLGIVAAVVSLLTLYLTLGPGLHSHDWRPVAFYSGFCALTLTAAILLALQWRNETLALGETGLLQHDWLNRPTLYGWTDVTSAIERRRPDTTRLLLKVRNQRTFVLHDDWLAYRDAVEYCREQLRQVGKDVMDN